MRCDGPPNKSLDASGGSVFLNLIRPAKGVLIRAAASTEPLGGMMRLLTLLLLAFINIAPGDAHPQCLKCEPNTVTLEGSIYSKDFPGPPNYQSIRGGDERMRYWTLRLNKSICVEGDDFDHTRVANVRDMQLVFMDPSFYNRYRRFVRQRARFRVIGSLFHQETGHHVTKILINVTSLVPLRK